MQSCATMETQDSRGGHGGMLTDSLILPQSRAPFILTPASVCPAMEGGNGLEVFLLSLLYCVILCYTLVFSSKDGHMYLNTAKCPKISISPMQCLVVATWPWLSQH